ncbi:MAG: YjbH domain-containing protein [Alphaproteobacteria bacterium]|nr:YjbH domain-containing protein [Alphaproteobacteria bacterium]
MSTTLLCMSSQPCMAKSYSDSPFLTGSFGLKNTTHDIRKDEDEDEDEDEEVAQLRDENIVLRDMSFSDQSVSASLQLDSRHSTMNQIGRAARIMAKDTDKTVKVIEITPFITNIRGPKITLLRSDLENAFITHDGSPQEIWQNTEFTVSDAEFLEYNESATLLNSPYNQHKFGLHLEQDVSLAEKDHGLLHRTSLILEHQQDGFLGFLSINQALRVNLAHNLEDLNALRSAGTDITKGDLDLFADRFLTLDHAYVNYSRNLGSSWYGSFDMGYLEEFYIGAGAQVLFRPFTSRLALGGEIWDVVRRDPHTPLNMSWADETSLSGHMGLWYDVPVYDVTLNVKAGRFLAGDKGVEFGAYKSFENGAKLSGNIVLSDKRDHDAFGGSTHRYHSLNLVMPIGSLRFIPDNSHYTLSARPLGRNYGQSIDIQNSLYERTSKIMLHHLAENFKSILD